MSKSPKTATNVPAKARQRSAVKSEFFVVRHGVRSVVQGGKLVQIVSQAGRALTLSEIGAASGMSASRAHRYLASLIQLGLIEQDRETGRYDLGPALLELGLAALSRVDAVRLASVSLRQLSESTGIAAVLVVWGSHGPTVIKWEPGRVAFAPRIREGHSLSLIHSSAGRVFLAFQSSKDTDPILKRELEQWNAAAPDRALSLPDIDTLRDEVKKNRLGRSVAEQNPSVQAISAPVFDHDGRLRLTLTLLGLIGSFDPDYGSDTAAELMKAAEELSRKLGSSVPVS